MDNPIVANQSINVCNRIQWHEGMLVSPHHFQQQDLRFEQLLSINSQFSTPFNWGILSLEIDPSTIPDGVIRVNSFKAIFPDGIYVSVDEGEKPLEINISEKSGIDGILTIYLCVPNNVKQSSSVAGDNPRYSSVEGEDILDDNTFDNPIRIPRLIPKTYLRVGTEKPENNTSIPILKVSFREDVFIQEEFIPPVFSISKIGNIWERCSKLLQNMREKVVYLSTRLQSHSHDAWTNDTSQKLRSLLSALIPMEAYVQTKEIHPKELYFQLSHSLSHLAATRVGFVLPLTIGYSHNDIYKCFNQILLKMENILERIEQNIVVIPFVKRNRFFSLKMNDSYLQNHIVISVKACSGMTLAELEEWCINAVISCESQVNKVKERRVSGAYREILGDDAIAEYMPGRGIILIKVNQNDEFVESDEYLSIFNPSDMTHKRPSEIALFLKSNSIEIEA